MHGRSGVCCSRKLLCTTSLDTTNSKELWLCFEQYPSPMWQWECHKNYLQPLWAFKNQTHWYLTLFFERPHHQRRYCDFPCENQWTTHWYLYQTSWWEKILRAKEWIQYHWFPECGLVCCTSDLKFVMLEKYTFMSKILFTLNFIHALWFKWF
jgi:hypothetical protein